MFVRICVFNITVLVVLAVLAHSRVTHKQCHITVLKVTCSHVERQAATSWPFANSSDLFIRT